MIQSTKNTEPRYNSCRDKTLSLSSTPQRNKKNYNITKIYIIISIIYPVNFKDLSWVLNCFNHSLI